METETIDRLFLELAQFTTARTPREVKYQEAIGKALFFLKGAPTLKDVDAAVRLLTWVSEHPRPGPDGEP